MSSFAENAEGAVEGIHGKSRGHKITKSVEVFYPQEYIIELIIFHEFKGISR